MLDFFKSHFVFSHFFSCALFPPFFWTSVTVTLVVKTFTPYEANFPCFSPFRKKSLLILSALLNPHSSPLHFTVHHLLAKFHTFLIGLQLWDFPCHLIYPPFKRVTPTTLLLPRNARPQPLDPPPPPPPSTPIFIFFKEGSPCAISTSPTLAQQRTIKIRFLSDVTYAFPHPPLIFSW